MERDLTDVCSELHNYFSDETDHYNGEYTISGGTITLPFLLTGQYFRILGSALNDGVFRYPVTGLADETFSGSVWAMRVPLLVLELAAEIGEYRAADSNSGLSPYTAESFGGYSYTKATASDGSPLTWKEAFKSRLNRWRKMP